jgi:deoxyribonuclease V
VPSSDSPIAAVDVDYAGDGASARAACVVARGWTDSRAVEERVAAIGAVAPYRPGHFFERELPCILQVLTLVREQPAVVIIDGYVTLDAGGSPGLGAHLYERLSREVAVVGVAKRPFRGASMATEVFRGASARALFVTALGIDVADAAQRVAAMHGAHRIPTLIGRADRLARGLDRPLGT